MGFSPRHMYIFTVNPTLHIGWLALVSVWVEVPPVAKQVRQECSYSFSEHPALPIHQLQSEGDVCPETHIHTQSVFALDFFFFFF